VKVTPAETKTGKSAVMIQARMSSSRIPGKVMTELYPGWPMLKILIHRMKRVRTDLVVVNTSDRVEDQVIEDLALDMGVACHRGSLDDVLGRHIESAERFGVDICAIVGGDLPLMCPKIMSDAILIHRIRDEAMTYLFDGVGPVTIYGLEVMKYIHERADDTGKEHMAFYASMHPDEISVYQIPAIGHYRTPFNVGPNDEHQFRWTRALLKELGTPDPDWLDVCRYLKERPDFAKLVHPTRSDDDWEEHTALNGFRMVQHPIGGPVVHKTHTRGRFDLIKHM